MDDALRFARRVAATIAVLVVGANALAVLTGEEQWIGVSCVVLFLGTFPTVGAFWWLKKAAVSASAKSDQPRHVVRRRLFRGRATLVSVYVVAASSFVVWYVCLTAYVVVVRNESSRPISAIQVFGGGASASIDELGPHSEASRWLWISVDGELKMTARLEAGPVEQDLDSCVTSNLGGRSNVVVHEDDSITVEFPR